MRITDLYFSWWLHPGKSRTLIAGGLNRTYLVHVPKGDDQKTPLPVVLALHGATMNGPMMACFAGPNRPEEWPPDLLSVARSIERIIRVHGGTDPWRRWRTT